MKKEDTRFVPWLSLTACVPLVQKHLVDKNDAAVTLIKAAAGLTEASAQIEAAVTAVFNNQLASPLAQAQSARKAIAKISEPTLKRARSAADFTATAIDFLTKKSDPKVPEDFMGAMQHQEVRSVLLKMTDIERRKAIANAISSGDETFLAAAVSGSPTLSGMTAAEQSVAREQWRNARHPDTAAKIEQLRAGLGQVERLSTMFGKWCGQLVDEPNPNVVAAAEATATAASKAAS